MSGASHSGAPIDWESFYRGYRKPGYVPGYEITSKLGGGMFGLVFKAQKQSIGKDYAIKFLKVDDEEVRSAVVAELESVKYFAQVDHPNLVSIEDRGEVDGIPYIVMAYAGAETLRDRLNADDADPARLVPLFLQACRGVQALHERSLVHFDLKPANVFIKGEMARVGDYGLSKLVAHSRNTLSMGRGTPYYMAPEMLQRKGDARSDIYSLGVMLYECLVGEVPFQGDSEWEVLRKHETEAPRYPESLPESFRAVLDRCLAKAPEDRFASVAELIDTVLSTRAGVGVADAAVAVAAATAEVPHQATSPARHPDTAEAAARAAAFVAEAYDVPRRAARRARRRTMWRFALAMVVIFAFVSVLFMSYGLRRASSSVRVHIDATQRHAQQFARSMAESGRALADRFLHQQLKAWQQEAALQIRSAHSGYVRGEPPLDNIDYPESYSSGEQRYYKELLEPLAEARQISKGYARKLERMGYPIVLAAVDTLQELDYEDGEDDRAAANLHQLLESMTGVDAFDIKVPRGRSANATRRGNSWAAFYWRELVNRMCCTEHGFEQLLKATGKLP